jgi:hypothetical protein
MKQLMMIALMTCSTLISFGQNLHIDKDGSVLIDSIVKLDSVKSSMIYKSVKDWASNNFNNIKEVTVIDSPEMMQFRYLQTGILYCGTNQSLYTTLKIDIREGKYRISFTNIQGIESYIKDGELRMDRGGYKMYKSIEDNFKSCVININKVLNRKDEF